MEFTACIESIIERIAYELELDPLAVHIANIDPEYEDLIQLVETLKTKANYESRRKEVDAFNAANRWKKRGLRFSFLRWAPIVGGMMNANISVFRSDGSVHINHGGIEIGQGINTKAIQICSKLLGVPVESIKVGPADSIITANCFPTSASTTSENVAIAVTKACEQLLKNLEATRDSMTDPTWKELIDEAFSNNVDLQSRASYNTNEFESYQIYGACLTEVEVDILTYEVEIKQLDVMEDVGASVNPAVDIGQVT